MYIDFTKKYYHKNTVEYCVQNGHGIPEGDSIEKFFIRVKFVGCRQEYKLDDLICEDSLNEFIDPIMTKIVKNAANIQNSHK